MPTAKTKTSAEEILFVQIFEPAPNPMFTEEHRAAVKFLHYNKRVACAECGKLKRRFWTMLVQFKAADLGELTFVIPDSGKSHAPLTPVCTDHLMSPAWPQEKP